MTAGTYCPAAARRRPRGSDRRPRIVLPLATPPLATLAALTFLDSWNNFLWPLIAVTSISQMTLPLGLATFQGAHSTEWPLLMAGNVMSLATMLVIFFHRAALLHPVGSGNRASRNVTRSRSGGRRNSKRRTQ